MSLKTRWEAWSNMEKPGDYLYGLYIANALEKECKPLFDIMDTPQDPKNHPEGSAGIHSIHAVDAMARICRENNIIGQQRKLLILASLLHDVGKVNTTKWNDKKQKWTSYNHQITGVPIAIKWLKETLEWSDFDCNIASCLIRNHMEHISGPEKWNEKNITKLIDDLRNNNTCFYELWHIMCADLRGRPPLSGEINKNMLYLNSQVEKYYPGLSINI